MGGIPATAPEVGSGIQYLLKVDSVVSGAEIAVIAAGDWAVVQAEQPTEPDQLVALGLDGTVITDRAWAQPPEDAVLLGVVVGVVRPVDSTNGQEG